MMHKSLCAFIIATLTITVSAVSNAQTLKFGNRCVVKGTHSVIEFEGFLHVNGQWQHVDEISMTMRISGQGSQTIRKYNTNYINKNYTQIPWGCPRSCVSGYAVRGGVRYTSRGFCRGG